MHFEILLLYAGERLLPFFLSCYIVGSCACRSWFLIDSKWNTGQIKFKLMQKMRDVCSNDWNKVSQNVTEEFSWKVQWPVYKNNTVDRGNWAERQYKYLLKEGILQHEFFMMKLAFFCLQFGNEMTQYNLPLAIKAERKVFPSIRALWHKQKVSHDEEC